jgi:hypothetical protein
MAVGSLEVTGIGPEQAERAEALPEAPANAGDEPVQISKIPGAIPAKFMTAEMRANLITYLNDELSQAESERSEFIRKIARWEEAYQAPMPDAPKHFPIYNASNLTMPVIKEAVNTLAAQLVQATDTARPRWILKQLAKEWDPFIDRVERFLDLASDRDMNLSPVMTDWIVECTKLGTSILEIPWEVDERKIYKYDESGKRSYPSKVVLKDGPSPRHIPLTRFWIRFHERDIQKARWCATEVEMSEVELREGERHKKFHSIDKVLGVEKTTTDAQEDVQESIEKTKPVKRNHSIFIVWLSWDIDGDNTFEETKLYFHRDTSTLIGEFFNPYWHARRPFVKIGYFPHPNRFYDEGLCEMLEQIQIAISEGANKRADNAALANLKMFLKRKTVRNLQPGDPLYSGKIIEVNDPSGDVRELQMSEIYPSTINEERLLQSRAERVAGTNEGIAGAAMPVTRTTASAQIALLQEQAKRIDLTVRSLRRGQQEIGWYALQLYSQFGTQGKAVAWMGRNGIEIDAVFRLPRRVLEIGMSLHAQTPTSMQNKQVQRENKIALFNLLLQLHKELFALVAPFAPETIPVVAAGAIKGAQKFMGDVLRTFEETDPEGILASLSVLEKILPQMENLGGNLGDVERGVQVADLLDRLASLEQLAEEAEASAEGSRGITNGRGDRTRLSAPQGISAGNGSGLFVGGKPDRVSPEGP